MGVQPISAFLEVTLHSGTAPRAWYYPKPLWGVGALEWLLMGLGTLVAYLFDVPSGTWH